MRLTGLDGRVYELDDKTLEKFRIRDEEVEQYLSPPVLAVVPLPADNATSPDGNNAQQDA